MPLDTITAGPWSLVPALLAISLAWYTRDALVGLFVGVASAATVYGALTPAAVGVPDGVVATRLLGTVDVLGLTLGPVNAGNVLGLLFGLKIVPQIVATAPLFSSAWYVENVLVAIFAIGGMMGLMIRSGAIRGVLEALAARVDSPADAEKASFLAGILIHIDDYFNCLVVGSMMRPLTDEYDVSRAKLAYYVDSAGSPAARLAFYSTWGVALISFMAAGIQQAAQAGQLPPHLSEYVTGTGDQLQVVTDALWPLFFNSIAFGFYSWTALLVAALVAWQVIPNVFGMKTEEDRARAGDGVVGPDDDPMISDEMEAYEMYEGATPRWTNFAIPIAVLIAVALGGLFWTGSAVVTTAAGSFALHVGGVQLGLAATTAMVVAFVLYRLRGDIPSNDDGTNALLTGFKGIFLAAVILMLATSIQRSVTLLGISTFVTDWFQGVPAAVIPFIVFLVTSFISFSDGSSWSTYGIMFPIAIPVAFTTGANLPLVLGAVFSGGIFGDHSSPISDTTVLASSTSGSDHMVHVRTQIPYAIACAAVAGTLFLVLGFLLPEGFSVVPY